MEVNAHIPVGKHPRDIGVNTETDRIYVANHDDNTVSVIDGTTLAMIGKPIPVGRHPLSIGIDRDQNRIYVANGDNSLSVINGQNNTIIRTIRFDYKLFPLALKSSPFFRGKSLFAPGWLAPTAIDEHTNTKYIANYTGDNVSVFNQTTGTMIGKPIPVGKHPTAIGVNIVTDTVYVANNDDGTVSVIDGAVNKVVARVMFNIKPFNSGYVVCDNTTDKGKWNAFLQEQFYVYSGSVCTAKPYPGFDFLSWQANLGHNSTQLISLVPPPSIVDSILDFLHMNHDKPQANLNITKFGNFTASFNALPPPIPAEYVATLFGIVATAFVGSWLTPAIIGWRKTKRQRKYFRECENQIGKLDKNAIEEKIIGYYVDGKISQEHRQLLNDKISEYYEKEKSSESTP